MNFVTYYINGKVLIKPSSEDIKIPDGGDFEMSGNKQLSKDLDRFLFSYYKTYLFHHCDISGAVFESLTCVIIMIENVLEVVDEKNEYYKYWKEILIESKKLAKELQ